MPHIWLYEDRHYQFMPALHDAPMCILHVPQPPLPSSLQGLSIPHRTLHNPTQALLAASPLRTIPLKTMVLGLGADFHISCRFVLSFRSLFFMTTKTSHFHPSKSPDLYHSKHTIARLLLLPTSIYHICVTSFSSLLCLFSHHRWHETVTASWA
jgi:hypothetical protein